MRRAGVFLARLALSLCLLALLAGFAGAVHPAGDSLAVFRIPLALAALILTVPARLGRLSVVPAGFLLLLLAPHALDRIAPPEVAGEIAVYQKNVWHRNTRLADLALDIMARDPDIVTLQELTAQTLPLLSLLDAAYPYQQLCQAHGHLAVAILSRHPPAAPGGACPLRAAVAVMPVEIGGRVVRVTALHLPWPWPYLQRRSLPDILALVDDWPGPQIIAGDFNMVPWGHSVRAIARQAGARRIGAVRATFDIRGLTLLPIDHVLATGQGGAEVLPRIGSDHHGVWAMLTLDPPVAP